MKNRVPETILWNCGKRWRVREQHSPPLPTRRCEGEVLLLLLLLLNVSISIISLHATFRSGPNIRLDLLGLNGSEEVCRVCHRVATLLEQKGQLMVCSSPPLRKVRLQRHARAHGAAEHPYSLPGQTKGCGELEEGILCICICIFISINIIAMCCCRGCEEVFCPRGESEHAYLRSFGSVVILVSKWNFCLRCCQQSQSLIKVNVGFGYIDDSNDNML